MQTNLFLGQLPYKDPLTREDSLRSENYILTLIDSLPTPHFLKTIEDGGPHPIKTHIYFQKPTNTIKIFYNHFPGSELSLITSTHLLWVDLL